MTSFKTLDEIRAYYDAERPMQDDLHGVCQLYSDGAGMIAVWHHPGGVWHWYKYSDRHGRYERSGSTDQLGDDATPIYVAADLESMVRELFTHVDRAGQPHQRQTRPGGTAEYSVLVPIPAELLRRLRAALESEVQL
jgi:hypothetical protein